MKILGVGPLELALVAVLAVLVLGPEGMVKAGRKAGKYLRKLYLSDFWQTVRGTDDWVEGIVTELGLSAALKDVRVEVNQNTLPTLEELDDIKSRMPAPQEKSSPLSQPRNQGSAGNRKLESSSAVSAETDPGQEHGEDLS